MASRVAGEAETVAGAKMGAVVVVWESKGNEPAGVFAARACMSRCEADYGPM